MLSCFVFHFLTADNLNTDIASKDLMLRAIENPETDTPDFDNYFEVTPATQRNVCDFRGVRCLDGEVISFVFGAPPGHPSEIKFAVSMDWLPSSLRILALCNVSIGEGWVSRYLPRNLRAMHLLHCLAPPDKWYNGRVFDLRHLPEKMVELRSAFSWFAGQVVLTDLPKSLRMLQIWTRMLRTVYFDAMTLPSEFKCLYVWNVNTAKIRVKSINGPKGRLPVVEGAFPDGLRDSPYVDFVEAEFEEIQQPIITRVGRRDLSADDFDL